MAQPESPKELLRQWVDNWKVVEEESDRLKMERLRTLTETTAAEQFNDLDCDPSLVWTSPERLFSSGLVEQQRLFSLAQEYAPGLRRRS